MTRSTSTIIGGTMEPITIISTRIYQQLKILLIGMETLQHLMCGIRNLLKTNQSLHQRHPQKKSLHPKPMQLKYVSINCIFMQFNY